jgi:cytochrome bd-type quinol oxidase subunit 2
MEKAERNERRKLAATYYNNLAVATAVTGFVVPYFTFVLTPALPNASMVEDLTNNWYSILVVLAALLGSVLLHRTGRAKLEGMED